MTILNAPYIRLDSTDVDIYRHIRDQGPTRLTELARWFPAIAATTVIHRTQRLVRAGLLDSSTTDGHVMLRLHPLGEDRLNRQTTLRNIMLRALLH